MHFGPQPAGIGYSGQDLHGELNSVLRRSIPGRINLFGHGGQLRRACGCLLPAERGFRPHALEQSFASFDAVAMESLSGLPKRLKNSPLCNRFLQRLSKSCS
jgi:hypothetical protein